MRISGHRRERLEWLKKQGFLDGEAWALSQITPKGWDVEYLKRMLFVRRMYFGRVQKKGISRTSNKYRDMIYRLYDKHGWYRKGKKDPWAMLKDFRRDYPPPDEYAPPWLTRQRRVRSVKTQEVRETKRAMARRWANELETKIQKSSGKQKAQYERQLHNLESEYSL